jgi:hypothetical protein
MEHGSVSFKASSVKSHNPTCKDHHSLITQLKYKHNYETLKNQFECEFQIKTLNSLKTDTVIICMNFSFYIEKKSLNSQENAFKLSIIRFYFFIHLKKKTIPIKFISSMYVS